MRDSRADSRWGIGIAAVYIAFAALMLAFVLAASLQRTDLVADDYYDQEVKYQQRIDQIKRSQESTRKVEVSYQRAAQQITLQFPSVLDGNEVSGNVVLFRPSNASLDRNYSIQLDEQNRQQFSTENLIAGNWRLMIHWEYQGEQFFSEELLTIGR